ncbi:putative transcription factor MADS-type1 family [Helianthus annuus]|uniref:Transcription factor MADS-type1 family n=1 Tax=Helianthus annuus TaxID=4232 RepID=A0A9K3NCS3_HELAN|nr:putative transcription factor MADS-type1 family [Helianthus annuus]KAJ0553240.1 putative transcription factor MADS-type1 family [Helianthus annuus]
MPRKRKGRHRIQMARSVKASTLLVTFSKCCCGLFTNTSELSILCGVEIAIIVFSPGKKVFSFGNPSIEMIVDSFLTKYHAWILVVEQGKMFIIS